MKLAQIQRLSQQKFKRRTGMGRQTYYVIVNEVKEQEKNKKKPGRTCKLTVEEQVLMTIEYWREYRPPVSDWSWLGSIRIDGLSNGTQSRKYLD